MEIEKDVPIIQKEASPSRNLVSEETHRTEMRDHAEDAQADKVVSLAPEFTVPLSDATIQEGKEFSFECRLIGEPTPEIVWYKDGISILNNPDYVTTYTDGICTLKIEETFAEDSAKYTCRAFNIRGSVETSATLTVIGLTYYYSICILFYLICTNNLKFSILETITEEQPRAPVFVKELLPSSAREGSSHRLECTVEGNPLPTVQWYKNDTNIDNSPDYVITFNNGEAVLKFDEIFLEDKALYTCKATNRWGQSSTAASLDVERKIITLSIKKERVRKIREKLRAFLHIYIDIDFSRANFHQETILCDTVIKRYDQDRAKGEIRMRS